MLSNLIVGILLSDRCYYKGFCGFSYCNAVLGFLFVKLNEVGRGNLGGETFPCDRQMGPSPDSETIGMLQKTKKEENKTTKGNHESWVIRSTAVPLSLV